MRLLISCILLFAFIFLKIPFLKNDAVILIGNEKYFKENIVKFSNNVNLNNIFFDLFFLFSRKKIKKGIYSLKSSWSIRKIIEHCSSGNQKKYKILIPEGVTIHEVFDKINKNPLLRRNISNFPEEGNLLPDTYCFFYGENRQKIIDLAKKSMDVFIENISGYNTLSNQRKYLLKLASVIEKETSLDCERSIIAGVFLNRLQKGMKLQSDPTTIYSITKGEYKLNRNLSRKDLKIPSDYNTYFCKGLPKSPIACPGKKSILAALKPKHTDFLFFVANGKGGHNFSKTFKEHNNNIKKWKNGKKRKKKVSL